jgi:hypothetical protein
MLLAMTVCADLQSFPWIPAFAGMTFVRDNLCDPVALYLRVMLSSFWLCGSAPRRDVSSGASALAPPVLRVRLSALYRYRYRYRVNKIVIARLACAP